MYAVGQEVSVTDKAKTRLGVVVTVEPLVVAVRTSTGVREVDVGRRGFRVAALTPTTRARLILLDEASCLFAGWSREQLEVAVGVSAQVRAARLARASEAVDGGTPHPSTHRTPRPRMSSAQLLEIARKTAEKYPAKKKYRRS